MTRPLSVGITMGDPAEVGPEIVCRALGDLSPAVGTLCCGTKSIVDAANKLTGAGLSFGEPSSDLSSERSNDRPIFLFPVRSWSAMVK